MQNPFEGLSYMAKISNPKKKEYKMENKIRERLDLLRTALQNDGGDLEVVSIEGKTVNVRLRGACGCCPHAMATLKGYIQQDLNETIDEEIVVERVE